MNPKLAATAFDSELGPNQPQATAYPCSGESSSYNFSRAELAPFLALENQYADLFASHSVVELENAQSRNLNGAPFSARHTLDVDLDECRAINLNHDGFDSIGTEGLTTCIGIAARGQNTQGETILSLYHYSGNSNETAVQALDKTRQAALNKGGKAETIEMFLVGGMTSKDQSLNTLERERNLLRLHQAYNIRGAKLHTNRGLNMHDYEQTSMVVTANQVYYSKDELYQPD